MIKNDQAFNSTIYYIKQMLARGLVITVKTTHGTTTWTPNEESVPDEYDNDPGIMSLLQDRKERDMRILSIHLDQRVQGI